MFIFFFSGTRRQKPDILVPCVRSTVLREFLFFFNVLLKLFFIHIMRIPRGRKNLDLSIIFAGLFLHLFFFLVLCLFLAIHHTYKERPNVLYLHNNIYNWILYSFFMYYCLFWPSYYVYIFCRYRSDFLKIDYYVRRISQ